MTTTGYSLATSPIIVDGISLLESQPPQCLLHFYLDVVGVGHVLETSHSMENQHISIFVTHILPDRVREHVPQRLNESINLGVLPAGRYVVTFYLRGDAYEGETFAASKSVVLSAQGEEDAQLPPNHSQDWHAWVNAMPPGPQTLHVTGTVSVPEGNKVVKLVRAVPQGFNPRILMLDLQMHAASSRDTEVKVHYSEVASVDRFDAVHIRFPNGGDVFIDNIIVAY